MPQNTHLELISAEAERLPEPAREAANVQILRKKAAELACSVTLLPEMQSSATFRHRCGVLKSKLKPLFAALESSPPESPLRMIFAGFMKTAGYCMANFRIPLQHSSHSGT